MVGYVRSASHTRTDCHQPLRAVCEHGCGEEQFWRCHVSAEVKCGPCSERNRKLLVRIIDQGLSDRADHGHRYLLTLNAPGDPGHSRYIPGKPGKHGPCPCWDHGKTLGHWNAGESACWNRLRLALARFTGGFAFIGSVEVQQRGALHRHVIVHSPVALLVEDVHALALAAGYGCVMDLQEIRTPAKTAWYISKYVTKSSGQRQEVPWEADVPDRETGEIRRMKTTATYRTWSAAQSWGYTMKDLRERMQLEARRRATYLRELQDLLATATGSLAPEAAADVHMTGPPT